jgi:hypothetical protein
MLVRAAASSRQPRRRASAGPTMAPIAAADLPAVSEALGDVTLERMATKSSDPLDALAEWVWNRSGEKINAKTLFARSPGTVVCMIRRPG